MEQASSAPRLLPSLSSPFLNVSRGSSASLILPSRVVQNIFPLQNTTLLNGEFAALADSSGATVLSGNRGKTLKWERKLGQRSRSVGVRHRVRFPSKKTSEQEYQELEAQKRTLSKEERDQLFASALNKQNYLKNRYPNILANETTRVHVKKLIELKGSDYVNANFVYMEAKNSSRSSKRTKLTNSQDDKSTKKVRNDCEELQDKYTHKSKEKKATCVQVERDPEGAVLNDKRSSSGSETEHDSGAESASECLSSTLVLSSSGDMDLDHGELKPFSQEKKLPNNEEDCISSFKAVNFVSAQAPLPNTLSDFWWMCWEQNTSVIVMLTRVKEKNVAKAHVYWPTEQNAELSFDGDLLVSNTGSEKPLPGVVISHFKVKCEGKERSMDHIHFVDWPDFGVPENISEFVSLLRLIQERHDVLNKFNQGDSKKQAPIVIHCSAGVGRTGVLVASFIALYRIQSALPAKISPIVSWLRAQRTGMVQTLDQYTFIHKVAQFLASENSSSPALKPPVISLHPSSSTTTIAPSSSSSSSSLSSSCFSPSSSSSSPSPCHSPATSPSSSPSVPRHKENSPEEMLDSYSALSRTLN